VGVSLALVGICSIIVQATLVRPLVKRFGEVRMLLFALTCGTAGFFVMGRAPNDTWIWMGIPILAGMGFFMPSLQGLMTQRVAPHNQGKLQGANGSIMGITGILGPPIFTRVYDLALQERDWFRAPGAPFYLASAMLVLAAIVALVMARRRSIGRESTST
jgi:DHA1 family tetracycline resistance protein-like MFS transporter